MSTPVDLSDAEQLETIRELAAGNCAPLAAYLEAGNALTDSQRHWLVRYLRGDLRLRRGRRRTFQDDVREQGIRGHILSLQILYGAREGLRGSYKKALEGYYERNPRGIGVEALDKLVHRNGGGLSQEQLRIVEQLRKRALLMPPERRAKLSLRDPLFPFLQLLAQLA